MNAQPADLLQQTQQLSESVTRPIQGSRKVHVEGSRPDLRVPMREIALAATPRIGSAPEPNAPFCVYDTSGPYTDPDAVIDLSTGLAPLRAQWIAERGDTEHLAALSSEFGRGRERDARLDAVRFPGRLLPRCSGAR
jgi:phosphomethylpyrimidine synthase